MIEGGSGGPLVTDWSGSLEGGQQSVGVSSGHFARLELYGNGFVNQPEEVVR